MTDHIEWYNDRKYWLKPINQHQGGKDRSRYKIRLLIRCLKSHKHRIKPLNPLFSQVFHWQSHRNPALFPYFWSLLDPMKITIWKIPLNISMVKSHEMLPWIPMENPLGSAGAQVTAQWMAFGGGALVFAVVPVAEKGISVCCGQEL